MKRDVLVIGAGVLGLSSALHLKRRNPEKRVTIIDMQGGPGQGNTAKSAGIFLSIFTTEINRLQKDLDYGLDMHHCGYLYS